jgi:hypothetical protein
MSHSIKSDSDLGPVFGSGYDIIIQNNSNSIKIYSNLFQSYGKNQKKGENSLTKDEYFFVKRF